MKRFQRVLTSAQSSVKPPVFRTLTAFPCEQFVCHSRGLYSLLLPGQCHKYSPPKQYNALSEINHSLLELLVLSQSSISSCIIQSYIVASSSSACGHSMTRCTCRSRERCWLRAICLATVHLLELFVLLGRLSLESFILDACGDRS